uniref:Uncharacterized protein n=1 Tax=Vombatus ursinus TaxID=29139 RepID=A0A4X2KUM4_VOMUR
TGLAFCPFNCKKLRMHISATLQPTRLCQSIILSVKAPACDVPSHFTLHVRWQTKCTNGVNSLICWLLPCIN